jgi:hypothetical protein
MGKNKDLIQILILVLIGMFIPFLGSIIISFDLNVVNINDLVKIGSTFGYFLLIFGIEMAVVYLYFTTSSWTVNKKMKKYKPKH